MSEPTPTSDYRGEIVAIVGLPSDLHSSYLRGCAQAPGEIRKALASESANSWTERGLDLGAKGLVHDAGDLDLGPDGDDFDAIERGVRELVDAGARVLSLGGDHAVTHPVLRAHRESYPKLSILHFDAHPDMYEDFEGDPRSHASPFARILEDGVTDRLVQVGIRTRNAHQREQAERYGVESIDMREWARVSELVFEGPVYLSFDIDVLDPAYAPGVSHWEPGGASTRQVLDLIERLDMNVVGADVVELNPTRDTDGITAMTAARIAREIAGKMIEAVG